MNEITLTDNPGGNRFELSKGGAVAAFAEYTLAPGVITFTHTEVLPGNEGQGLGSRLAVFALDNARGRGLKVVPKCEFFAGYIAKHANYQDLLSTT
ncbi:MAG: N-acetyltransferase [Burkholderiales bacterium]|nr:N-acetyltransferase [Burkholderiales bacterium]